MADSRNLRKFYEEFHERVWKKDASAFGHLRGEIFAKWIGKGKKILDLGCRRGEVTAGYVFGNQATCLDFDFRSLRLCKDSLCVNAVHHDLGIDLPFLDATFEVVVAAELLEHLYFPAKVIKEANRVLVPRGLFLGSVPNAFYRSYRLKYLFGRLPEAVFSIEHIRPFSYSSLSDLLKAHFREVDMLPFRGKFRKLKPSFFAKSFLFKAKK